MSGDSVGQSPSLADLLKMVHPRPIDPGREALYGWLIGRDVPHDALPEPARAYEAFKAALAAGETNAVLPQVNFQLLTALALTRAHWVAIAERASWHTLWMNLNTFVRHGVFEGEEGEALARRAAAGLSDADVIRGSRVMPFQLLATWRALDEAAPAVLREAVQDALEAALENVPRLQGRLYVFPDVSGSMGAPISGWRGGGTSKISCRDAAALITAAILRRNPAAEVIAFDDNVYPLKLNPRDSLTTNAEVLAATGGGGTNCSLPLMYLNERKAAGELAIYVSDNESWIDSVHRGATATLTEWEAFKQRNPQARLACIDLQPYASTQATSREDILNVGGFSDAVFSLIHQFAAGRASGEHWVAAIEAVEL